MIKQFMSPMLYGELTQPPGVAFFVDFTPFNPDMAVVKFQKSYALDYINRFRIDFRPSDSKLVYQGVHSMHGLHRN